MKTTFFDVAMNFVDEKPYERSVISRAMGRIKLELICPFCSASVVAYLWSLSGGGKRCPCGALFGSTGKCYHKRTKGK